VDLEELKELIQIFEASKLSEIEIEQEGRRVCLKKPQPGTAAHAPLAMVAGGFVPPAVAPAAAPLAPDGAADAEAADPDEGLDTIDAPMVGTFYVAHAPGEEPFVHVGETVEEGQVVCIVEAMKLKNEVTVTFAATIEDVLVENGESVEYGQALFAVRPLAP